MNRSTRILAIVLIIFALSPGALSMNDGAYPKTIVDSAERMITIPAPISRIIVLNSDAAEEVVTLGAGGEIVGITDEVLERSSHLPGLMGKQVIGTRQMSGEIDYELIGEIASAKGADPSDLLVIGFSGVGTGYGAAEAEKKLTPFGIRNVGLDDLVRLAGGRNIAENLAKTAHIAWEWVLSENPDVILRTMSKEGSLGWESGPSQDALQLQETAGDIMERPGTTEISAAKTGNVFIVRTFVYKED